MATFVRSFFDIDLKLVHAFSFNNRKKVNKKNKYLIIDLPSLLFLDIYQILY
jgi:hypothetical protein